MYIHMYFLLLVLIKLRKYRNSHCSQNESDGNFFLRHFSNGFISSLLFRITTVVLWYVVLLHEKKYPRQ